MTVPEDRREMVVGPAASGERLDRMLAAAFPDLSRSRLQSLVRGGAVELGGARTTDPARRVVVGTRVTVVVPHAEPAEPRAEALPLAIVFEDGDLLVVDKPAGLVVHPAPGHADGTLVNALIAHCGDSLSGIGGVRRPGIVHRLDKDTSGLLVVAKNDFAHRALCAQFADHGRNGSLRRAYRALVWGAPNPAGGIIDAHLARSHRNREKIAVVSDREGRRAVTRYTVEAVFAPDGVASLVRCELETGRTHQIRVHFAHIGHALLGDAVYGGSLKTKASKLPIAAQTALAALGRQALHAVLLGFAHPRTGRHMCFESPLPEDVAALAQALSDPRA